MQAFGEVITRLAGDPALVRSLGVSARRHVELKFSRVAFTKQLEDICLDVADTGKRAASKRMGQPGNLSIA
jgi:hypothetical protein